MLPEIGQFTLILACVLSFLQMVYPLYGVKTGHQGAIRSARILTILQFVAVACSFAILAYSFLINDSFL